MGFLLGLVIGLVGGVFLGAISTAKAHANDFDKIGGTIIGNTVYTVTKSEHK